MKLTKSQRLFIKAGRIAEELRRWKEDEWGDGGEIHEDVLWLWKHHHGQIFYQLPDTIKFLKKEYKKTIREAIEAAILEQEGIYGEGLADAFKSHLE